MSFARIGMWLDRLLVRLRCRLRGHQPEVSEYLTKRCGRCMTSLPWTDAEIEAWEQVQREMAQ